MRILHVIPAVARRYGGPSSAIRALCQHLARLPDTQVEVATTDADGAGHSALPEELELGVPVHVFRRTFSERWKYSPALRRWLVANAGRYDLLHVHALWSHSSSAAAAAAVRARVPYIVRPAGMLSEYTLRHRAWGKRAYWWWRERSTIERAAAVHATSELEREDILKVSPRSRVFVFPNGVEDSAWKPPVPRETTPSQPHPTLLFLSRLHPKKGVVDLLLPAVACMKASARLVIAGGVDEHAPGYVAVVRSEIARLGLADRVTLTGPVSPGDRWRMYDASDVFVLPSHSENFGIVVAEAMARGRPVVVTDGVQIADHVRRAEAGIVVGRNVQDLAAALDSLLANPGRIRQMGHAGREYSRAHYSWDAIAANVRTMYERVIAPSGSGAPATQTAALATDEPCGCAPQRPAQP